MARVESDVEAQSSYITAQRSIHGRVLESHRVGRGPPVPVSYVQVFRATPFDRIQMIKDGVRAVEAKRIFADLALAPGSALAALNLSAATVNRKAARDETLAPDESERVIGVARLIGQVQAMVEQSGTPEGFNASRWISRWLEEPLPALGGSRPVDLLDTMEGQALVADVLARAQSGAYA